MNTFAACPSCRQYEGWLKEVNAHETQYTIEMGGRSAAGWIRLGQ
jgi:hypothetical protein